jgi:hypothetical protein
MVVKTQNPFFYERRQIRVTPSDLILTLLEGDATRDRHNHVDVPTFCCNTSEHATGAFLAMFQSPVSRSAEALVRSQGNPLGICGVLSSTVTCFPPEYFCFPTSLSFHQHHSSTTHVLLLP